MPVNPLLERDWVHLNTVGPQTKGENSTQGRKSRSDAKTPRFQRVCYNVLQLHPNNTFDVTLIHHFGRQSLFDQIRMYSFRVTGIDITVL